ncbi:YihY/virulence factor BrkB family protein [Streptomyces sp. NPDC058691]|uniref:YihY/virulence factor BrkB family protein n=1 Tax=Streptomyces sp. NPDC058691 TaxID=3346601 RepID=UPI00365BC9D9
MAEQRSVAGGLRGTGSARAARAENRPYRAAELRELLTVARGTAVALWDEDASEKAAALTYYGVLTLFPGMLLTVSVIGLADASATGDLIARVSALAPAGSGEMLARTMRGVARERSAAWVLAVTSGTAALWSAVSYLAVFRRALHSMNRVRDHRPSWRAAPRIAATASVLLTLMALGPLTLMLTGRLARRTGELLGVSGVAVTTWNVVKWPLLLCLTTLLVLVLFRSGPPQVRPVRAMLPGGVLAVLLWLASTPVLTLYVAHVGTYSRLYGPLAGTVVFLMWLWVSNLALLSGAHFNAELRHHRRAAAPSAAGRRDEERSRRP